jgi:putative FmdB family regulatory protein
MPMYEYHCLECDKVFERIQKFSDEPLTIHEDCGGKLEKLLSAPAFQFKGSGWYVTDYGKGNNGKAGVLSPKSNSEKSNSENSNSEKSSSEKSNSESSSTATKSDSAATSKTPAATPAPAKSK